jgi:hypothetical protein
MSFQMAQLEVAIKTGAGSHVMKLLANQNLVGHKAGYQSQHTLTMIIIYLTDPTEEVGRRSGRADGRP